MQRVAFNNLTVQDVILSLKSIKASSFSLLSGCIENSTSGHLRYWKETCIQ